MKPTFLRIWEAMDADRLSEAQATAPAAGQQQQGRFSQAATQQLQQLSQMLPNFMRAMNDPTQVAQQLPVLMQAIQQLYPSLQGWQQEMQAATQQQAVTTQQPTPQQMQQPIQR